MLENDIAKIIKKCDGGIWIDQPSIPTKEILSLPLLKALLDIYYQTAGVCKECEGSGGIAVPDMNIGELEAKGCWSCQGTGQTYDIKRVAVLAEIESAPTNDKGEQLLPILLTRREYMLLPMDVRRRALVREADKIAYQDKGMCE